MIAVLVLAFVILLLLSVPIGHALVIAGLLALTTSEFLPMNLVAQQMFAPTQSFPMLALPFFILAGSLMMSGELGRNLIDFAKLLVQRYRGGLASVTVLGSATVGGVSGSAVADATAMGSILIPWQTREGYPAAFNAANNAATSMIAVLIPPSIPLILYSLVSGVSIGDLFIAGVLPGLTITAAFIAVCYVSARLRGFPCHRAPFDWRRFWPLLLKAIPALALPVMILVLLRFGIATPTEVSVLATLYALCMGLFVYRDLSLARIKDAVLAAGISTGVVMLVIMGSSVVAWLLTYAQIPQTFTAWCLETLREPWAIILVMNAIMLLVGMFIDLPAAILLLGPIFVPLAQQIGLDPLQLGIVMVLNLSIGLYTPPAGTTLFISSTIARVPVLRVVRELLPFYLAALLVLLLFSYVPALTLRVG
ncbi:membrane protein [Lampropedia cohaerens]|uniref:TRAP transporter large permease protein n=1 Tax=Lampropedia cohaerens TaxID=1610491 RepID=A0A0U1Q2Q2_9BURK|nr:TRAP transporter large permease [Lampropedia cohaerens]KKW69030.1 membrane protein [Lampropedia cohaerens]